MNWKLQNKLEKIVDKNVKEIPYEGKEIDKSAIIEGIDELYTGLMKGLITHLSSNYTWDNKGYKDKEEKYHSREELIEDFYNKVKWL